MVKPLQIKSRKVADLIPYANNAKIHSNKQISLIAASITEYGFNNPVLLDGDSGIIAGHGRVKAAQKLKLESVPTIELSHLTSAQKKAYILADNRLSEVDMEWNYDLVSLELQEISDSGSDISLTGFDDCFILSDEEPEQVTKTDDDYGGATSLQRGSAPMRYWNEKKLLEGMVLDYGCGNEVHEFAKYDMVTYPEVDVLKAQYDVVMCNYVLNVQPSDHLIDLIISNLRGLTIDGGKVLIAVVTDKAMSGKPACGKRDAIPPAEWNTIISRFFDKVETVSGGFCGFICTK